MKSKQSDWKKCIIFYSLHAGYFSLFYCRLLTFFFLNKLFQELYQSANGLDPDQDLRSDLGPNCLQMYQLMTKFAASKGRVKNVFKIDGRY